MAQNGYTRAQEKDAVRAVPAALRPPPRLGVLNSRGGGGCSAGHDGSRAGQAEKWSGPSRAKRSDRFYLRADSCPLFFRDIAGHLDSPEAGRRALTAVEDKGAHHEGFQAPVSPINTCAQAEDIAGPRLIAPRPSSAVKQTSAKSLPGFWEFSGELARFSAGGDLRVGKFRPRRISGTSSASAPAGDQRDSIDLPQNTGINTGETWAAGRFGGPGEWAGAVYSPS